MRASISGAELVLDNQQGRVRVRRRGELNLTRRLRDTRLRGGAKQFAFTFRRGAAPIFLIRCSEPGTGLRRCQS